MKFIILILSFLFALSASSQVLINEYSASNMNGITDNFNDREDWVELYNPSGAAVDLTDWYLSDRAGNLLKWQFPAATTINASDHLLLFCVL